MTHTTIMISGANRGLGLGIAQWLSRSKDIQLSLGMRQPEAFDLASHFPSIDRVRCFPYDAAEPDTGAIWVADTLKHFGHIHTLINNAGIFIACGIENYRSDDLNQLWRINTQAPIELTHHAWDALKTTGRGRVVTIASLSAKCTNPAHFGYNVSKHAIHAFTHSIRQAGFEHGIRAVSVCPGWVNTDMAPQAGCTMQPEACTQPESIGQMIETIIRLPNTASVGEVTINAGAESWF